MATLNSPGVSVSVINESFYLPSAPGTIPLIVVASAANKTNPSGVTAPGTLATNAGVVYTITSQRDLTDTFGTPLFYTDASGNPLNGNELNEYGLQAAYSFLGVSSQAYVVRAPLDLSQLIATSSIPAGAPADGSYWLDTTDTAYGIFQWNSTNGTFGVQSPIVIDDTNSATNTVGDGFTPIAGLGNIGSYAVVSTSQDYNPVWFKNTDGNWVLVGSDGEDNFVGAANNPTFVSTVWSTSWPAVTGTTTAAVNTSGNLTINGQTVAVSEGALSVVAASINNARGNIHGVGAKIINGSLAIFADSNAGGDGSVVIAGDAGVLTALGLTAGTYTSPRLFIGPHTQYPDFSSTGSNSPSGSVYMKTTTPNSGAKWVVKQYSANTGVFNLKSAPVYGTAAAATYNLDKTSGGALIKSGTVYVESNIEHGDNYDSTSTSLCRPVLALFALKVRATTGATVITGSSTATTYESEGSFQIAATQPGSAAFSSFVTISVTTGSTLATVAQAIQNSGIANLGAVVNANGTLSITQATGGEIKFIDNDDVLGQAGFVADTTANYYSAGEYEPDGATAFASNWMPLTYTGSPVEPTAAPANGQLWYSSIIDEVDIMYNNGSEWIGYKNAFPETDPNGPQVSYSAPLTQSDGTPLVNNDIWVFSDPEQYGQVIYVYQSGKWVLQDPTDHTGPSGWVFADARWATNGAAVLPSSIKDLLTSNYVDPDMNDNADPEEYPRGTRLWNLRRSGFNVKQYVANYINVNANEGMNLSFGNESMADYNPNRWISVSPNNADGTGTFGRHAQRALVVKTLKSTIDSSQAIRDTDTLLFNLIACPGYIETLQNMIELNTDRGQTAFVVGDTPFRLKSDGTTLQNWGNNTAGSMSLS